MANKPATSPVPAKPAGSAEKRAARKTTDDGLQPGREDTKSRKEIRQDKVSQGQPNRG